MCDSPLLLRETKSRGSYSYIFRKWREIPLNRFHTRLRVVGVDGTRCGSGEYRCAVRTVTDWKRQNCQRGGQRIAIGKQAGKVKKKQGVLTVLRRRHRRRRGWGRRRRRRGRGPRRAGGRRGRRSAGGPGGGAARGGGGRRRRRGGSRPRR
jgi:hypothetical protein